MKQTESKTVAIVGRPNVGKSTLFNRLIGRRQAIETEIAGTTRDRLYGDISWSGQKFSLIDLAGIEAKTKTEMARNIQAGIELAIEKADLILFLLDWEEKNNELDQMIARRLRPIAAKVILVVNKADNLLRQRNIEEFKRLGHFEIIAVSAISGQNSGDLLDLIYQKSRLLGQPPRQAMAPTTKKEINLTIVGRPNVGKSTLLNIIIGQKRAIVSQEPGTTRDSFSVRFKHKNHSLLISDTAGIRRRGKIKKDTIESFAVLRSWRSLRQCDVAILIIDGLEGITANDNHLLGQIIDWGKATVLAVNKIDLWSNYESRMTKELEILKRKVKFAPWLPVVFISAEKNQQIKPLLDQVVSAYENRRFIIPQEELDRILDQAKSANSQLAATVKLSQKKSASPIFSLYFGGKTPPHQTQIRYLENKIRDHYPLYGSPIFIDLVMGQSAFGRGQKANKI